MDKGTIAAMVFSGIVALAAVGSSPVVVDYANDLLDRVRPAAVSHTAESESPSGGAVTQPEQEMASAAPSDDIAPTDGARTGSHSDTRAQDAISAPPVIEPSFGLLRVEPDGSTVIAGQAGANADIEILAGADKLASARAAANGDFVAVLDTPLAPGDYEIVLRSVEQSGSAMSSETAIVSVPDKGREGEVLALVEKPGKPSRLITTPEGAENDAAKKDAVTAKAGEGASRPAEETDMASAQQPETPAPESGGAPAQADMKATGAQPDTNAAGAQSDPDTPAVAEASPPANAGVSGVSSSDEAAPDEDEAVVAELSPNGDQGAAEPDDTDLGQDDSDSNPGTEVAALPSDGAEEPRAETDQPAAEAASPDPSPEQEVAAVSGGQEMPSSKPATGDAPVRIEAVEIDNEKVFVAGAAAPGSQVRVYANDILLGDTIASAGGRVLIETSRDLPVGDYIIRADVIDPGTAGVKARAAVPFTRSEGERLSAVAVAPDAQADAPDTPEKPVDVASAPETGSAIATGSQPSGAADVKVPLASAGQLTSPPVLSPDVPVTLGRLQQTNSSVIIRRGDTLWQISRRIYGRGIRYTTIYLANQDQILDPDRIWPGQIFGLPGQAIPTSDEVAQD